MLQTLNFSGPRLINAAASFFRYESGSAGGADESIRVRADGADLGLYFPGDAIELPQAMSGWEITPTTPACFGVVRLGVGRVQSARLVGTVSVVDTAKATTIAGQAFAGKTDAVPGAAQFGAVQLWNPSASGKRLIVESVALTNAATAQNLVVGLSANMAPTSDGQGLSKMAGAAAAAGQVRKDASLASIGSTYWAAGIVIYSAYLSANGYAARDFKRPIVLMPGYGIAAAGTAANATHGAAFEWVEEPIG